jgi:quinol monooxygenase YgiN
MIGLLKESAADMPGCFSYVVAKDTADENVIWVTEAWESVASHDASRSLPSVKNTIPRAKTLISNFEKIAVTIQSGKSGCHQHTPTDQWMYKPPQIQIARHLAFRE